MAKYVVEYTVGHYYRAEVIADSETDAVAKVFAGEALSAPVEFGAEIQDDYEVREVK